jgi:hypothetical protein
MGGVAGGVPGGLKFHELSKPKHLMKQLFAVRDRSPNTASIIHAALTASHACIVHAAVQLREKDPGVRIIIFTEHGATQAQLVSLFSSRMRGWQIYEFNQSTPPQKRHRIIREFQANHSGACAWLVLGPSTSGLGVARSLSAVCWLVRCC